MSVKNIILSAAGAGGAGNPNAWDISKAYYDAGADAGNVSKAIYTELTFPVVSQETAPEGVFFKPDGTKMYIVGSGGVDVNEYTLSVPWEVAYASYVQNFSVSAQDNDPQGIFFSSDGIYMYIAGNGGNDINQYTLSTAWDISSASYTRNFSVSGQDTFPADLYFSPDGTKMYVLGLIGVDVNEYTLGTAWNISTATYVQNKSVSAQESSPTGLSFLGDGTKMYVIGLTGDDINEYSLSTPWDISTASYVRVFSIASQETSPRGMYMKSDGSRFWIVGDGTDTVYPYLIGTFSVAAKETNPFGVFFKPDGTIMYITGSDSDAIHSYTLSTAWDITTASFTDTFSVSTTSLSPNDLFFKADGTKMYLVDSNSDDVQEFSLSVAWDISTLSYVQNFSIAAVEGISSGLFFKSDGTKMYVVGSGADTVLEYALSTAWDISSASYTQGFSVAAQETSPQSLSFKADGTEMYIIGSSGDDVNQYTLSVPWDISTASYSQKFGVPSSLPRGLYFRDDGMKFFTTDSYKDAVYSFSISEE